MNFINCWKNTSSSGVFFTTCLFFESDMKAVQFASITRKPDLVVARRIALLNRRVTKIQLQSVGQIYFTRKREPKRKPTKIQQGAMQKKPTFPSLPLVVGSTTPYCYNKKIEPYNPPSLSLAYNLLGFRDSSKRYKLYL